MWGFLFVHHGNYTSAGKYILWQNSYYTFTKFFPLRTEFILWQVARGILVFTLLGDISLTID
jgi:hypothetical protein